MESGIARRKDKSTKYLGLDEKSFLKGHSYATVLNNLEDRSVIDVIKNRDQKSTEKLLDTALSEKQKEGVLAMSIDMWTPYMNVTNEVLPEADIVHDKFHIAKHLGKAVDSVRKEENKYLLKMGDSTLVKSKYLWLTNPINFTEKAEKKFREFALDELKVGRAWSIKEAFRHFWDFTDEKEARIFFKKWYFWATHSRLKPIIKVAKTIKKHFEEIITYLKHLITNAGSEGINSKIQSLKNNVRGFRNFENFRIAILFECGKLDLYP